MGKDFMAKFHKLEGAVKERRNIHSTVIATKSPSLNFTFGNGWGLPLGYSVALAGMPKSGKSLILRAMIAQMHADYPDGIAVVYNTEQREEAQLSPQKAKQWGIDLDRYFAYETNHPKLVFDAIWGPIQALIQEGANIKLIAIDSITGIQGRRGVDNESIMDQTIGDLAMTIQEGLKKVLEVQRKHKIGLILTTQVRAEMDKWEIMRGNKVKMAGSFGLQHHCEYFMLVDKDKTKEGRIDLLGNEFKNEELTDSNDDAEKTGHKIKITMKDSSLGPIGRTGVFTLDYNKGIVNVHEEIFTLGVNRGIIQRPNNRSYEVNGKSWSSKESVIQGIKDDVDIQAYILKELKAMDYKNMVCE